MIVYVCQWLSNDVDIVYGCQLVSMGANGEIRKNFLEKFLNLSRCSVRPRAKGARAVKNREREQST